MIADSFIGRIIAYFFPVWWKEQNELLYWKRCKRKEQNLSNAHYESAFTTPFEIGKDFFSGKSVLDIGCGPRGSLEWADVAEERVGLDPLVNEYKELGIDQHQMQYVDASSENIPFPDAHFDIVSSLNSLDHVEDIDKTIKEIKRVLKPGGVFLLITDVNHDPTPCEPQAFSWDIVERFSPELKQDLVRELEKKKDSIYASINDSIDYNHENESRRYGILVAMLSKRQE